MAKKKGVYSIRIDKDAIEYHIVQDMAKDCERLVYYAIHTATFTSQTGNLVDSYGAAVYKDGVFVENTFFTAPIQATVSNKWYNEYKYGKDEMIKYFRDFKPRTKGFTIVLVAAMPYAEVLEKGSAGLHHKYKVISGAYSLLQDLAENYSGKRGYKKYKLGRGVRVSVSKIG